MSVRIEAGQKHGEEDPEDGGDGKCKDGGCGLGVRERVVHCGNVAKRWFSARAGIESADMVLSVAEEDREDRVHEGSYSDRVVSEILLNWESSERRVLVQWLK